MPQEVPLDSDAVNDILHMFRNNSSIRIARDAFVSMTICDPFTFSIPKLGIYASPDMERIVRGYWMPWQRHVLDNMSLWDLCPYYMKPVGDHLVPVVPELEKGIITTYLTNDKYKTTKYRWRWACDNEHKEAKDMLWIVGDHPPNHRGVIQSRMASLLQDYRTIMVLQRSLEITATQNAHPTHILEYHQGATSARNDHLTDYSALFSEKAAGLSKDRQSEARAHEVRIRTDEALQQMQAVSDMNANNGLYQNKRLMWTDLSSDVAERMNSGLVDNLFPLRPNFKYVQGSRPTIVAELEKHLQAFNHRAAANMGFSMEFINPSSSNRAQNVKGSERFENERVKHTLGMLIQWTQTALVVAYAKQFEAVAAQVDDWQRRRRRPGSAGDPEAYLQLVPELDVEVHMTCTPFTNYEELQAMHNDGIMSKEVMATHAYRVKALPLEDMDITEWPDMVPKELLIKPTKEGEGGSGSSRPLKKRK